MHYSTIIVKVAERKFKDIQGPGRNNLSFTRTFKDFKDIAKISRISRFFKDRGNHAWCLQDFQNRNAGHCRTMQDILGPFCRTLT